MSKPVSIIGAGLAGCNLAWQLHLRDQPFTLYETNPWAAGSLAAAGMLSPVTGKAFNPSWMIEDFYAPALEFYAVVEETLGVKLWYSYPVLRLFFDEADEQKFAKKRAANPALEQWVAETFTATDQPTLKAPHGGVTWKGSGRLDVKAFVLETRRFFLGLGQYVEREFLEAEGQQVIYAGGSKGLLDQCPTELPHRSAKGEILTLRIPGLAQDQILSRGTWIVPTGRDDETFLAGATYEWDDLSLTPTEAGREKVLEGVRSLISAEMEVVDHTVGVRPIVRKSEPVIGGVPGKAETYVMNGLGSKGVLYAPRTASRLIDHILEEKEIPVELDVAEIL